MDFFAVLIAYATNHGISEDVVTQKHQSYCQNLYWQPDSEQKMLNYGCDIYETDREIARVKLGRY